MRPFFPTLFFAIGFACFFQPAVKAQNCNTPTIFFPDTVCLGQSVKGKNLGPANWTYSWDVCGGDLFKTPVNTPFSLTGAGASNGLKVVKVGTKYYGFMALTATNELIRLDFDTSIGSTPTVVNLGNPGNALNAAAGFELEQENGNYFGFSVNRTTGQLVRFQFGADITSTPTSGTLSVPTLTNSLGMDLVKDGSGYFAFITSFNSSKLYVLSFGSGLTSTPAITNITLPSASCVAALGVVDCSGKYVFVTDYGSNPAKIFKLKFASAFTDVPVITTLTLSTGFTGKPTSLSAHTDGGRSLLLLGGGTQGGGIGYLNFGNTYATPAPGLATAIPTAPFGILGLSDVFYKSTGEATMIYTTQGSVVGRITFPSTCPVFSGSLNGYQPPALSFSQPGKYFVNYQITDNSGNSNRYGDSLVVKAATASNSGVDLDFTADEQCITHLTKFYPEITPPVAGSYRWTFPGGSTSNSQIGSHQFATTGTYPVSLYFSPSDGCGSGNITKPVKIFSNPSASITSNFTLPPKICTKDSVVFLDASTPASDIKRWRWEFGNGQTAFTKNGKTYYASAAPIQVKLTASDSSGCGITISKPVSPEAGADVEFAFTKLCLHDTARFQNLTPASPGVTYLWNFGDAASGASNTSASAAPFVPHIFSDSGLYDIKLRAINSIGCTSQVNKPFRVFPLPVARFSFPILTFINTPVSFTNQSSAQYQSIQGSLWNFGDPGSGISNTSAETNPSHSYPALGTYPVKLTVTTNKGCIGDSTIPLSVFPACPDVQYVKTPSSSGDFDTTTIHNQTDLVKANQIDFCAGDLEQTPILQSQSTGATSISGALQVVPVKNGDEWIGFIPAPISTNATSILKAKFGNSLNNDIGNFVSDLGNPSASFSDPKFIRFFQEDTVWYGIAANATNKLYRLRFGSSLNNIPTVTPIQLPVGTLSVPTNAVIAKDKDSIYVFILNNNNDTANNVIRLRFGQSLSGTPEVKVFDNPPALQNSTGFFSLGLIRECDRWVGLLVSNSQLYRLNFGFSLNNVPGVSSVTSEVTALLPSPSVNVFNNLRGVSLLRDMGRIYCIVNTSSGGIFRIRFGNGLLQPIDAVGALGSFGISGIVGQMSFVQEGSEVFGLGINTLGVIFKFKFPNHCSASKPFVTRNGPATDSTVYQEAGKYYITITAESPFGTIVQKLDSVEIGEELLTRSCKTMGLNHRKPICFDYQIDASVQQSGLQEVKWDFCTGDFKLTPTNLAVPFLVNLGTTTAVRTVIDGGSYYSFVAAQNGFYRIGLATPGGTPALPVQITIPPNPAYGGLQDFRIFKEGNRWFALCTYIASEGIVRLNFGSSITNTTPSVSIINLSGLLAKCRTIDLFEDHGNKYAMVANQDVNSVVVLNFGKSYINIPQATSFDVPPAINLLRISVLRDCNLWHAFVSDEKVDSVFQLTFNRGLSFAPSIRKHFVSKPRGLSFVKDGNDFFGFIVRENAVAPASPGQLMRFSFGNSLDNVPVTDSLGTFTSTTPATGLNRINGLEIFKNQASENFLFGVGSQNSLLYRIAFKNPCAADRPVAFGDTVFRQSYHDKGKYFFAAHGIDAQGDEVLGFDSVLVLQPVVASIGLEGNRCVGEVISFKDSSIYDGIDPSLNMYQWNFGDLNSSVDTSNAQFPSYTFSQPGQYAVKLKVEVNTGCINQAERVVQIVAKPKVDFSFGNGGSVCTNDSVIFKDLTTTQGDPVNFWEWTVKKDNLIVATSNKANPKFLFSSVGSYEVSLKARGQSNCDSMVTKTVIVGNQGPVVSFSNPSPCLNDNVQFTSSITLPTGVTQDSLTWFLDTPLNPISDQQNLSYQFSSTGFYTIGLVVHTQGCSNSYSKTFKVSEKPGFNLTIPTTLQCQNYPLGFGISGLTSVEEVSFKWDFGDGTFDSVANAVKTFSQAGTFTVKLRVTTDNGCYTEKSAPFTTKPAPQALFSFDKSCKDEPVTWTNLSTANGIPGGITSYFWEFDDPLGTTDTSKIPPPLTYFNVDSNILVKLTVRTASECPNTYTKKLQIGSKLNASFDKEVGCIGTPFKFYDKSRADQDPDPVVAWSWSIGGFPFNVKNPVVEFDLVGVFDVRLEVQSQGGCRAVINATNDLVVNNPVQTDFTILDNSFSGEGPYRVRLDQTLNQAYEYIWDFGDSTTSSALSPVHFYAKQGTYVITLKASRLGTICSAEVQKVVNVVVNPTVGIKVEKTLTGVQDGKLVIGAELVNESNISLSSLNLSAQLGGLVTLNEKWTGILLPNGKLSYTFSSGIEESKSQRVPFVCVTAGISKVFTEITPENNEACLAVDTIPSLVSIYPNPADNHIWVEANLPGTDPVEMKIHDQLSREVQNIVIDNRSPGILKRNIAVSRLPQGVYYLTIKVGSEFGYKKFSISR